VALESALPAVLAQQMKGLRTADVTKTRRRVCGTQNAQREEAAAPTPSRQRIRADRMNEQRRMNELPRSMADELGVQGTPANPSQDKKLAMRKHGQQTLM